MCCLFSNINISQGIVYIATPLTFGWIFHYHFDRNFLLSAADERILTSGQSNKAESSPHTDGSVIFVSANVHHRLITYMLRWALVFFIPIPKSTHIERHLDGFIRLLLRISQQKVPTLNGPPLSPQNCPFVWVWTPVYSNWIHPSPHPKPHLDRFRPSLKPVRPG